MRKPEPWEYYKGAIAGFQRENEALKKALAEAVHQAEHVAGRLEQMQDMLRDYRALEAKKAQLHELLSEVLRVAGNGCIDDLRVEEWEKRQYEVDGEAG